MGFHMNPRTKAGERVSEAPKEDPAGTFRNAGGKSEPKTAELSILARFRSAYLCGGEIVEYVRGRGFTAEKWRDITGSVLIMGDRLLITSEKRFWSHDDLNQLKMGRKGDIFYLSGDGFPDLALAPMGVKIPEETMQDAIKDSRMLLQEGMGRSRKPDNAGGLEKLLDTDFEGGTLVELLRVGIVGADNVERVFEVERNRNTVMELRTVGTWLTVETGGCTGLFTPDYTRMDVELVGGIFIFHGPNSYFALAPKGITIPQRPTLAQLRDALEVLAGEHE
jgi:hypothetical protein